MTGNRLGFTKEKIAALGLANSGQRAYFYDTKTRGLALSITPAGTKTFILYRWVDGKPQRITLGRFPDVSVEAARRKADEINGAIAKARSNDEHWQGPARRRGQLTLAELLKDFLANQRNKRGDPLSEKTTHNYRGDFNRYLGRLAVMKLPDIRRDDIARVHTHVGKDAPFAANRALALVSSLFSYARKRGLFSRANPAAAIQKFPEDSRERFIGPDEMPRFFQALAEETSDFRDAFLLALLTGARRSNVLAMRWADVNLERAEWFILQTKNRTPHTVPLTPEAAKILQQRQQHAQQEHEHQRKEDSEAPAPVYVFPSRGKSGHLVEPKGAWRRILDRAELHRLIELIAQAGKWDEAEREQALKAARTGEAKALTGYRREAKKLGIDASVARIADLRIHDLRHTIGSALAATGANTAMTMQALGHKTASASLIYQKLHRDPIRQAMQRATASILEQAGLLPKTNVANIEAEKAGLQRKRKVA